MKTPLQLFLSAQTPEKILEMALDMACRLVDIEEVSFNEKESKLIWDSCGVPVGNTFDETFDLDANITSNDVSIIDEAGRLWLRENYFG